MEYQIVIDEIVGSKMQVSVIEHSAASVRCIETFMMSFTKGDPKADLLAAVKVLALASIAADTGEVRPGDHGDERDLVGGVFTLKVG